MTFDLADKAKLDRNFPHLFLAKLEQPESIESIIVEGKACSIYGTHVVFPEISFESKDHIDYEIVAANGDRTKRQLMLSFMSDTDVKSDNSLENGVRPNPGIDQRLLKRFSGLKEGSKIHATIQFRGKRPQLKQAQNQLPGIHFLYPTKTGWAVALTKGDLNRVQSSPTVRSLSHIGKSTKLALDIHRPASDSVGRNEKIGAVARFFPDVTEQQAKEIFKQMQLEPEPGSGFRNIWELKLTKEQALELASRDEVRYVDDAPTPVSDVAKIRKCASVDILHESPFSLRGSGIVVGMWDEGCVDRTHPDFVGRVAVSGNVKVKDHASIVGGILAGSGALSRQSGGKDGEWRGVAPGVQIKCFSFGNASRGLDNAIKNRQIDVANNSWNYAAGFPSDKDVAKYMAASGSFDYSLFRHKHAAVVFSAGNLRWNFKDAINDQTRSPFQTVNSPGGTAKNVICVGAIESDTKRMTKFSGWGPTRDGRLKPDLVAPGAHSGMDGIISTVPRIFDDKYTNDSLEWKANPDNKDDFYFPYTNSKAGPDEASPPDTIPAKGNLVEGTSFAAPVVTGIVAEMSEQYRLSLAGHTNNQLSLRPATTKAILVNTAEDLVDNPIGGKKLIGPDYIYGHGLVNGLRAVAMIRNRDFVEDSVAEGEKEEHEFDVPADVPNLRVTLCWDDPPAEEEEADLSKLVNDLDLYLVAPDGTVHYPWVLRADSPEQPAVRRSVEKPELAKLPIGNIHNDHANNCVVVEVEKPISGRWRAVVEGFEFRPAGPDTQIDVQEYSLAIPETWNDLLVRDSPTDDGSSESYAPWWRSPDIEVIGDRAFVTVHNRGYRTSKRANLDLYISESQFGPLKFDPNKDYQGESKWKHLGTAEIPSVQPGHSRRLDGIASERLNENRYCVVAIIRDGNRFEMKNFDLGTLARKSRKIAYRNVYSVSLSAKDSFSMPETWMARGASMNFSHVDGPGLELVARTKRKLSPMEVSMFRDSSWISQDTLALEIAENRNCHVPSTFFEKLQSVSLSTVGERTVDEAHEIEIVHEEDGQITSGITVELHSNHRGK